MCRLRWKRGKSSHYSVKIPRTWRSGTNRVGAWDEWMEYKIVLCLGINSLIENKFCCSSLLQIFFHGKVISSFPFCLQILAAVVNGWNEFSVSVLMPDFVVVAQPKFWVAAPRNKKAWINLLKCFTTSIVSLQKYVTKQTVTYLEIIIQYIGIYYTLNIWE